MVGSVAVAVGSSILLLAFGPLALLIAVVGWLYHRRAWFEHSSARLRLTICGLRRCVPCPAFAVDFTDNVTRQLDSLAAFANTPAWPAAPVSLGPGLLYKLAITDPMSWASLLAPQTTAPRRVPVTTTVLLLPNLGLRRFFLEPPLSILAPSGSFPAAVPL